MLSIIRSASGPEAKALESLMLKLDAGEIELDPFCAEVSRVRVQVLLREGPYRKLFPRSQETEDYCEMRLLASQGQTIESGVRYAGEKGRDQFTRWYNRVADAFDTRAGLLAELNGHAADREAFSALLSQGDQMASFYRGLNVPWWPRHMGDKYGSVLAAWGELRTHLKPTSAWGEGA